MIRNLCLIIPIILLVLISSSHRQQVFKGASGEVKIMTLDPGHFHAALIQKTSYKQVSSKVHVFAPEGSDVADHLNRIKGFNTRAENPTNWKEITYTGPDFLDKMSLKNHRIPKAGRHLSYQKWPRFFEKWSDPIF